LQPPSSFEVNIGVYKFHSIISPLNPIYSGKIQLITVAYAVFFKEMILEFIGESLFLRSTNEY